MRLAVVSIGFGSLRDGAARAGRVALRPALQHNGGVWLGWSGKVGSQASPNAIDQTQERRIRRHHLTKDEFQEYHKFRQSGAVADSALSADLAEFSGGPRRIFHVNDR